MGILPLIRELRKDHPSVTQPWCADGYGVGSTFEGIRYNIDNLMVRGNLHSYFPEQTKIILVVSPQNLPRADTFFGVYGL